MENYYYLIKLLFSEGYAVIRFYKSYVCYEPRRNMVMDYNRAIEMVKRNPIIIKTIKNPTEEMKLLAVEKDGMSLQYIKNPTEE